MEENFQNTSGLGIKSEVPDEVKKRFNWGAFLAHGYGVYLINLKERYDIFKVFSNLAVNKREKEAKLKNLNERQYFYQTDEMKRTKIYSSEKHELLAEYVGEMDKLIEKDKITPKDIFNEINNFKFYESSR